MTFKSTLWQPLAWALSAFNVAGAGLAVGAGDPWHAAAHAALALGFGLWALQLRQRPAGGELARMKQQLEQQATALEDVQSTLASQSTQLAELQERVDFAERVLAQARERPVLGPRQGRE